MFTKLSLRLLVLVGICSFSIGCPQTTIPENTQLTSDLVYGKGYVDEAAPATKGYMLRNLPFDLIEPTEGPATNRPAVLMIHGGSFDGGAKEDEDLVTLAGALAEEGYVCFLIDYRLQDDAPPAPSPFDTTELLRAIHAAYVDAKTAMRHIRANAATYGIDPNRIAVFGESAGAFAALAAGVSDPEDFASDGTGFEVPAENNPGIDPTPQVVIDFWGSADLILDEFDASDPPIMVVHGLLDTQVGTFYLSALAIRGACLENGIPLAFYGLPDQGHGAWDAEVDGKDLATLTLEFLAEHMP